MARTKLTPIQTFYPYKFSVYRNAAVNTGNGADALLVFDTKDYDTGTNFATGTGLFTAPVAGFYTFSVTVTIGSVTYAQLKCYKNASLWRNLMQTQATGGEWLTCTFDEQLAASDTIGIYTQANTAVAIGVGTGPRATWFSGKLMSVT